jgi:hypothetical protein
MFSPVHFPYPRPQEARSFPAFQANTGSAVMTLPSRVKVGIVRVISMEPEKKYRWSGRAIIASVIAFVRFVNDGAALF